MTNPPAQIGVTGLAVMGRNLARNLARHGYAVAVHNRTVARAQALVDEFGHEGTFVFATALRDLVDALERPRRIVIMVQAGAPTDAVIDELSPLLEPGDMIVDGGNAHFADTRRREEALRPTGIHFVGVGISGGEEGALHGPSIMPGGSAAAYESLGPILEAIAAKAADGSPCCAHLGSDGAGHLVKMVHNGIEYADMQLIAESYDLLRHGSGLSPAEITDVFRDWNTGRLDSYLIDITTEVLAHVDADTGKPFVDVVLDQAEQKGTGRWTVQTALDLGVPVNGIAEAVFARSVSGHADLRDAGRTLPGPGDAATSADTISPDDVEAALYASKIVSYAQGFHQVVAAAQEYEWSTDLGTVASLWRAGCIIRAAFLDRIRAAYADNPALTTLLADPTFASEVGEAQNAWRRVVAAGATRGIPTPGFSAALAYYDSLRADRLPAALVQGQRDYFGAHTYRRVDREGTFHTLWADDRREVTG